MATTARGVVAGANATNHECDLPAGFVAVPVLPATCTLGKAAGVPVPLVTTATIIVRTSSATVLEIGTARVLGDAMG